MNWKIESYVSDVGRYFVSLRGVGDWTVLDPSGTVYDGFTNENDAMAFAESLNYQISTPPAPPGGTSKVASPVEIPVQNLQPTSESP